MWLDDERSQYRVPAVLELVDLAEHACRPIAGFSNGMLRRIGRAQALLHEPALLFLDQPTSTLDPFGRMLVRTIIYTLIVPGTTVLLTSHLLGEVEAACDRVAVIRSGTGLHTLLRKAMAVGQLRVAITVDAIPPALAHTLDELARATDGSMIP